MKRIGLSLLLAFSLLVQFTHPVWVSAQQSVDLAAQYQMPGEMLYTYPVQLHENGQVCQLHLMLNLAQPPNEKILALMDNYARNGMLKAALVTCNGVVVEDLSRLNDLLTLWQAGYMLYNTRELVPELSWVDSETFASDMKLVIENPLFLKQMMEHLLTGKQERYRIEAWRGILHPQNDPPDEWTSIVEDAKNKLDGARSVQEVIDQTIEASYYINGRGNRIPALIKDFRRGYKGWNPDVAEGFGYAINNSPVTRANVLKLIDYTARVMWVTNLRQERAQWLPVYDRMFAEEYLRLDAEQRTAMFKVYEEAQNDYAQRMDNLDQVAREVAVDLGTDVTEKIFSDLVAKKAITLFGTKITSHALLASLAAVDAGLTVADFQYGLSGLYDNFWVAMESDLLRGKFRLERIELEGQARLQKEGRTYDTALIKKYQVVYMLESLAVAQMIRSYADGIDSTVDGKIFNPVNWFQGKDRAAAVADLFKNAANGELAAEQAVLYPTWVHKAAALSLERIALVRLTVDDQAKIGFTRQGPTEYWKIAPAGYAGQSLWTKNESSDQSNSAEWSIIIPKEGLYRVQAYIPEPATQVTMPYTGSAHYAIHDAGQEEVVTTSQAAASGGWADLGLYYFEAGQKAKVTLVDRTGEATGKTAVLFDAVQWLPVPVKDSESYYNAAQVGLAYDVVNPGETAVLEFTVQNTGLLPWKEGDYQLVGSPANTKEAPAIIPLTTGLMPGEEEKVTVRLAAPATSAMIRLSYQVQRNGQPVGPALTGLVVVLPAELGKIEQDIRDKIEEWQQQGEQKIEELIQQIWKDIQEAIEQQAQKQFDSWCGGSTSTIVVAALLVAISTWRKYHG